MGQWVLGIPELAGPQILLTQNLLPGKLNILKNGFCEDI
jgi:hypothetical protein